MTVAAFITNPINDEEEKVYIPISTEGFFRDYWMIGVKELNLKWVNVFGDGIEIEESDLNDVLSELSHLKDWANNFFGKDLEEHREYMTRRIDLLEKRLIQIFKRKDAIVFVG